MIYFGLSGLCLRWPRQPLDWRAWFVLDFRKSGRNFYRALHITLGAWVVLFYLVSATTGLSFAFDWYKDGFRRVLTGTSTGVDSITIEGQAIVGIHPGGRPGNPSLAVARERFMRETDNRPYQRITFTLPTAGGADIGIVGQIPGAPHEPQGDLLTVDGTSGRVIRPIDFYAARPLASKLYASAYEIHRGAFFGLPGRIGIFCCSLAMPVFPITGILLYVARRRKKRELAGD